MNYPQHAEEFDKLCPPSAAKVEDDRPEGPVIFIKADSSLLKDGKPFFVPDWCERVDYEAELVVRICRLGKGIPVRFAHRYWDAVTVGIDFTARDVQERARREGLPWTISKAFDGSAAIGRWMPKEGLGPSPIPFHLDKNGLTVQRADSSGMCFSIDETISDLSHFFTLRTGDLLFTGTPVGVGPVQPGDHLQGYIGSDCVLDFFCR